MCHKCVTTRVQSPQKWTKLQPCPSHSASYSSSKLGRTLALASSTAVSSSTSCSCRKPMKKSPVNPVKTYRNSRNHPEMPDLVAAVIHLYSLHCLSFLLCIYMTKKLTAINQGFNLARNPGQVNYVNTHTHMYIYICLCGYYTKNILRSSIHLKSSAIWNYVFHPLRHEVAVRSWWLSCKKKIARLVLWLSHDASIEVFELLHQASRAKRLGICYLAKFINDIHYTHTRTHTQTHTYIYIYIHIPDFQYTVYCTCKYAC